MNIDVVMVEVMNTTIANNKKNAETKAKKSAKIFADPIMSARFASTLFSAMSYPTVHLWIMSQVSDKMMAVNSIAICIAIICINTIWNKYGEKLYKSFPWLLVIEAMVYVALYAAAIAGLVGPIAYYVIDAIATAIISRNAICGGNKLRAIYYKDSQKRMIYDNNIMIIDSIASISGGAVILLIDMQIWLALLIMAISIVVSNMFYLLAYIKANRLEQ